ncbi:MAG TPA: hypothetical protein VJX71_26130 [Methylomirabilota bacterium]|nr:hypothetical protein [Methylomirabilota bacterium]
MGEQPGIVDVLFVVGALGLVIVTSVGVGHRRYGRRAEGQRTAAIGILVWLGLLGLALYLIFG